MRLTGLRPRCDRDRRPTRQCCEEHRAEAVHVGGGCRFVVGDHFGSDERRCTTPQLVRVIIGEIIDVATGPAVIVWSDGGQAEVDHAGPTRRQHDVSGLDVAVDHACRVRRGECPGDLGGHPYRVRPGQGTRLEALAQIRAVQQLHDQIGNRAPGRGLRLPVVVDLSHVRMADAGRRSGFAADGDQCGQVTHERVVDTLDRDRAAEELVLGQPHLRDPARADPPSQHIPVGQAQTRYEYPHVGSLAFSRGDPRRQGRRPRACAELSTFCAGGTAGLR
jgi:hypothetical protein